MALFSVNVGTVQRSKGDNAVKSAAYISRSELTFFTTDKSSNITGEIVWDYSDRGGLIYSQIFAPEGSPDWVHDREVLWNKAEMAEGRCDAQIARKIMIALQRELTDEQNIALVEDISSELVHLGMVVDSNIHTDSIGNPHAHLQLTVREIKENRFGEKEFSPIKNRDWLSKKFVPYAREMVCNKINKHLEMAGFDIRVTHESYKTLGIDLVPTIHIGPGQHMAKSELLAKNYEIIQGNFRKIMQDPTLILDKLAINKPVFTKEEIAKSLDQLLSNGFHTAEIKDNSDIEELNKTYASRYMELHSKIMNGNALSIVIDSDLKGRTLYTTTKRLEMEERFISAVETLNQRKNHSLNIVDKDLDEFSLKEKVIDRIKDSTTDFAEYLEKQTGIKFNVPRKDLRPSSEQRKAILEILNGPDISVLEGIPGSGKTVTMKEIVRQCKKAGKIVIGVAPSSAAALVLEKETGIPSKNASLLRKEWLLANNKKFDLVLRGDYFKEETYLNNIPCLTNKHVMIIDESSMMELSNMDYLMQEAIKAGAKVIDIGDNNQHPSVGWAGPYKKTIDICGSSKLEESRRQSNPLHQEATKLFGKYRIREALGIYRSEGAIVIDEHEGESRNRLISDYVDSYLQNAEPLGKDYLATSKTQVIITFTNEEAGRLNHLVRNRLKEAGIVKGIDKQVNVGMKKIALSRGDQIVFTRNFNYLGKSGIYNGEVGTIIGISDLDQYGNASIGIRVSKADGSKDYVIINALDHPHGQLFDYGYAVTSHKVQGSTIDKVFAFFERNMGFEATNVIFTRHRDFFKLYANKELLDEVRFESLSDEPEKAEHKYEIHEKDKEFEGLVRIISKRVNNSFALDYKNMGLTQEDHHIKTYLELEHESVEFIREIIVWVQREERRTGIRHEMWDHPLWKEFKEKRDDRNKAAYKITENYALYKDRIIQLGKNYYTVDKHSEQYRNRSKNKEKDKTVVERETHLHLDSRAYNNLVSAIDESNLRKIKNSYKALNLEIAENYAAIEDRMNKKDEMSEAREELISSIEEERNYREVLLPSFLSRVYLERTETILSNYQKLVTSHGVQKAANIVQNKASILGELKGIGFGQIFAFSSKRRDVIANTENLERSLLGYSKSIDIEKTFRENLEKNDYASQIKSLELEIEVLRKQLPSSLDEEFLKDVGSAIYNTSSKKPGSRESVLEALKATELFDAIKVGLYREEHGYNDQEDKQEDKQEEVTTGTQNKPNKTQVQSSLQFADVKAALHSSNIESVFRQYANMINHDGVIEKKGTKMTCGSLHINLENGLWMRFSDGNKGDIFGLVMEATGVSKREALEVVAETAGIRKSSSTFAIQKSNNGTNQQQNIEIKEIKESKILDSWEPYTTLPQNAKEFNASKTLAFLQNDGIEITDTYVYRNKEGKLLGYTIRMLDKQSGRKQVIPVAYCFNQAKNESRWQLKGFLDNGSKPIYRADELAKDSTKPILIVEGEKTAIAAAQMLPEYTVISWMGGAQGIRKVDWVQLSGREIKIWPDNDLPGITAAKEIAERVDFANGFKGMVSIVDTKSLNLPDKWDLADELPSHIDGKDLLGIIDGTKTIKFSTQLKESFAQIVSQNRPLDSLEMLIKTGRLDKEEVASSALYRDTLASISLAKGIDLNEVENFVDVIRDANHEYTKLSQLYIQENPASTTATTATNLDTRQQLEYDLVKEAVIMHQVMLGLKSLPKTHLEMIQETARAGASKIIRFGSIDSEKAGNNMYLDIKSDKWLDSLDQKNNSFVLKTKQQLENKQALNIENSIASQELALKQLETVGEGLDREELKQELGRLDYSLHNTYITNIIGTKIDRYLNANFHKIEIAKEAKTPEEMLEALRQEHEFHVDVYNNCRDAALKSIDHKFFAIKAKESYNNDKMIRNTIDKVEKVVEEAINSKAITSQEVLSKLSSNNGLDRTERELASMTEEHNITVQLNEFRDKLENATTIDKGLEVIAKEQGFLSKLKGNIKYPAEISKDLIQTIEIADKNNNENIVLELDKKVRYAINIKIRTEEELLKELKPKNQLNLKEIKNLLAKDIQKYHIEEKLEEFAKLRQESTTPQAALKGLLDRQEYLADMHGNLDHGHEKDLIDIVDKAKKNEQENIVNHLNISIKHAMDHKIIPVHDLTKQLKETTDPHEALHGIRTACIQFHAKTLKHDVGMLEAGKIVEFDGHKFDTTADYLHHWKKEYDHNLIPIKQINNVLHKIHQMQKEHEIGGPSL